MLEWYIHTSVAVTAALFNPLFAFSYGLLLFAYGVAGFHSWELYHKCIEPLGLGE